MLKNYNYEKHLTLQNAARSKKDKDNGNQLKRVCNVITMEVQTVKFSTKISPCTWYYKIKFCCHNFTVYNLISTKVVCYWFNKAEADGYAEVHGKESISMEYDLLLSEIKSRNKFT